MFFLSNAQEDLVRLLINKTEISIHKLQKEIIAGHISTEKKNELSLSIKYQVKAVEAFKNNQQNIIMAINYSSKAREIAIDVLGNYNKGLTEYFIFNDGEKQLQKNADFLSQKNSLMIDSNQIEESILLSAQELSNHYKITLN